MSNSLPDEAGQRFFEHTMKLWVHPELERRRSSGTLPDGFQLRAAQVVMELGGATQVRLNEEIRAVATVKATRPIEKGSPVTDDDFSEIEKLVLTDSDPNAGHVTLLLTKGTWFMAFDFRYNADRAGQHIDRGEEFLLAAQSESAAGRSNTAITLLFQAVELFALARLLVHPDERVMKTKTHGPIKQGLHSMKRLGNIDARFPSLLTRLTQLRDQARYPQRGTPDLEPVELKDLIGVATEFAEWVRGWIPERYGLEHSDGVGGAVS